jgi:diguanylate cyclase (GGDEF)-like protein
MSQKILVIEDNSISRKMVRVALEAEDYAVIEAADGKTSLALMTEQMPDLVLQDLLLPDVNGFDLVTQLRALPGGASIPIVALTGLIAKADEMRVAAAPFTDYLFKPVEPSLLVSTIRAHLASAQSLAEKPGKDRSVLVVDDEPAQLKLLATHLSQLGFEVTTATDGNDGLAKARVNRPDAILSDVLMPGMDGFQLCRAVRNDPDLCRIPAVLVSNSYDNEADIQLARNMGAYALVPRTPDFQEAIDALLKSLEATPVRLIDSAQSIQSAHEERLARQLDRHVKLSAQLARRSAAQSAQISVLASLGENLLKDNFDTQTLLGEILAQYLNVMGFSCGAIYLADPQKQLVLSAQIGLPDSVAASATNFFGHQEVLHDAMLKGEPVSIKFSPGLKGPFIRLLSQVGAETLLISPLRFRNTWLGVIVLVSDAGDLDADSVAFSKVITGQLGQVIALSRFISRLQFLASYDPLTNLPNRTQLRDKLQRDVGAGNRPALYLLNLDHFQQINNTLGYQNGTILLQQVAKRLREGFADQAMIARLDADEFALLSADSPTTETVDKVAQNILKSIEPTFRLGGLPVAVRASMGITLAEHGKDADTLLSHADMARRAAKKTGNDYLIYPAHVQPYSPDHLALLGELREAISHELLVLHYQPKVDMRTRRTIGVEALLRWPHADRGWIAPDEFIPLAEGAGLIHSLTLWVVGSALRQAHVWRGLHLDIGIAVNISARDLLDAAFPDFVAQACLSTGMQCSSLTLEITERDLMSDPAKSDAAIQRLKEMGIHFAIDDFGTGYSSLSYLQKLPVNEIKIDKSFVAGLLTNPRSDAIVRSIIDLGRNLSLSVVAEGVEDQRTWESLATLGCDVAQGYYMCRPNSVAEITQWMKESTWGVRKNDS